MRLIERAASSSVERLERYAQLYLNTLVSDRTCLAGMMASDVRGLPEDLAPALARFFEEQTDWLARVLADGKKAGGLSYAGASSAQAQAHLAALQGGLLISNTVADEGAFKRLTSTLIAQLK